MSDAASTTTTEMRRMNYFLHCLAISTWPKLRRNIHQFRTDRLRLGSFASALRFPILEAVLPETDVPPTVITT